MQTIVTDDHCVCLSVCHAAQLGGACRVCDALAAAFVKLLWPLVLVPSLLNIMCCKIRLSSFANLMFSRSAAVR